MRTALPWTLEDHDIRAGGAHWRALACALALAAAAAAAPAPAAAQGTQPCTEIENDTERLACYDRALRPNRSDAASRANEQPSARADAPRAAREAASRSPRDTAAPAAAAAPAAPRAAAAESQDGVLADVTIVAVNALPGRSAVFTTQSGEVWVQTDSSRLQLPDTPFDAQIKPGAMGSRFLVPANRGRAVRVRPRD